MRELDERKLPQISKGEYLEKLGPYPALDCEKRILELVTKLVGMKEEIKR